MENMGAGREQQVWNRVFTRMEEAKGENLRSLRMAAAERAGVYRYLRESLSGKMREQAKGLYEEELQLLACLKGIGILSGQGDEVLKLWNPTKEPPRKLLEKCYHSTRRSMVEYTSRSAEPEFGAVYRELARRTGKQCAAIAELLGGIK